MKVVRLNIQSFDDREKMITALANSGYHVWIERVFPDNWTMLSPLYYVCVEAEEDA